jgi:hypothetical protein
MFNNLASDMPVNAFGDNISKSPTTLGTVTIPDLDRLIPEVYISFNKHHLFLREGDLIALVTISTRCLLIDW